MDSTVTEVLKPSTLKYMYNVHWTDPDWKTQWGLGFVVAKGEDGKKWVGHGGNCPGYRSILRLIPDKKRAYSVMINANGTYPVDQKSNKFLQDYVGHYSPMPWGSELYVSSWYGKLAILRLPTESPAKSMTLYNHIDGDTFRRDRDNGEPGETLVFERDKDGEITRFKSHGNYTIKIIHTSAPQPE